jgi:lysophospholipase L1-like esterase
MKKIVCLLVLLTACFFLYAQIKVACIGNSITFGHGLKNDEKYPAQLQVMLGAGWVVQNFGVSGRTLLSKGDYPYIKEQAFTDAKAFAPDVAIIKLGTNDAKPQNWKYHGEFIQDYTALIKELEALPSHPMVIICLPVPAFGEAFRINDSIVNHEIPGLVKTIAKNNRVRLLDLYKPFEGHAEWFPDKIHPDARGAKELATIVSRKLSKEKKKILKRKKKNGV